MGRNRPESSVGRARRLIECVGIGSGLDNWPRHAGRSFGTGVVSISRNRGATMTYFTNASINGPLRCIAMPWAIGITASPGGHEVIGIARKVASTHDRAALWSLSIHGYAVRGVFIVDNDDGRFIPVNIEAG